MEDRVGDILAQRARLESGAGVAIFLSILFHATLTAIAGWSAWHHAAKETTTVMMIRFAQPQPSPEVTATPAPAVAAPAPAPVPVPKPVEKPKPAVTKKTAPPSPFGRSTKKAAEPPPSPITSTRQPVSPVTRTAATSTASDVPIGGSGVTGLEGGDFPYPFYIEQMKRLIGSHWLRPTVGDNVAAVVYFVIQRDGTIRDAKWETQSGVGVFDRAALSAVRDSSPLPPLPFGYNGTWLGVHLKFR